MDVLVVEPWNEHKTKSMQEQEEQQYEWKRPLEAERDEIPKSIGNRLRFGNMQRDVGNGLRLRITQGAVRNEPRLGNMQGIIGKKGKVWEHAREQIEAWERNRFGSMSPYLWEHVLR